MACGAVGDSSLARGALVEVTGDDWVFDGVSESGEGLVNVVAGVLCTGDVVEELLLFAITAMMNRARSATSPNATLLPAGVSPVVEAGTGD